MLFINFKLKKYFHRYLQVKIDISGILRNVGPKPTCDYNAESSSLELPMDLNIGLNKRNLLVYSIGKK